MMTRKINNNFVERNEQKFEHTTEQREVDELITDITFTNVSQANGHSIPAASVQNSSSPDPLIVCIVQIITDEYRTDGGYNRIQNRWRLMN
ncbi:hypothetical protein CEXT_93481 [Caerostris extrusa]|uniref:Uncharacterized protein n=1 Tax=Caerostris extrusa TaxID=172846 RepID=A0AAV4U232_CAEEX|nr:hypothetical protein CEXT_93481 [Caerostris extrusa]